MWQKVKTLNAVFLGSEHEIKKEPRITKKKNLTRTSW